MSWRDDALVHARTDYPRESCGLLIIRKGREVYWPCRNLAHGDDQFTICPDDYEAAEREGEVIAVVHSHVNIPPMPSQADLVSCEAAGLEWHIVNVPVGTWHSFRPSGYVAPLVGRVFSHGVLDCFSIIRDGMRQMAGIEIPDFQRSDGWWERGGNLYMENFEAAGFIKVGGDLRPMDVLFMQIGSSVPNHAALYLGDDVILHHVQGRLSSRDAFGGYWRKNHVCTVRHTMLL